MRAPRPARPARRRAGPLPLALPPRRAARSAGRPPPRPQAPPPPPRVARSTTTTHSHPPLPSRSPRAGTAKQRAGSRCSRLTPSPPSAAPRNAPPPAAGRARGRRRRRPPPPPPSWPRPSHPRPVTTSIPHRLQVFEDPQQDRGEQLRQPDEARVHDEGREARDDAWLKVQSYKNAKKEGEVGPKEERARAQLQRGVTPGRGGGGPEGKGPRRTCVSPIFALV